MAQRLAARLIFVCLVPFGLPLDKTVHGESPRFHLCSHFLCRPFTKIQEKYGPYVTGALFILKQGGAVKYGSHGDRVWEWGRAPLLSNGCVLGALLLDFSLSFRRS